ncbi:MAG: DUF2085 domain-containing protein [Candidatus Bathyarchaeia archaeon]|nr:DUF2085 domain-containing protein [Candidatus Bathyarchaeota archaeon]
MGAFSKLVKAIFFIIAAMFTSLLILCPILQPRDMINDLTGVVGIIDNYSVISKLSFPCQQVYLFGDIWCHQMRERTIFINGNQMAVCARCFGLFIGISIGIILSIVREINIDKNVHKRVLGAVFIGYTPLIIDYFCNLIGFWNSINLVRLITGAVAGSSSGMILGALIDVISFYISVRRGKIGDFNPLSTTSRRHKLSS